MSAIECLFCDHSNRAGAKFCEECGAALNLKLCSHCEAINERNAQTCHQCGTKFLARPAPRLGKLTPSAVGLKHKLASDARSVIERLADKPVTLDPKQAAAQVRTFGRVVAVLVLAASLVIAYYLYRPAGRAVPESAANQSIRNTQVEADPGTARTAGVPTVDATAPVPTAVFSQQTLSIGTAGATQTPPVPDSATQQTVVESNGVAASTAANSDVSAAQSDATRASVAPATVKQKTTTQPLRAEARVKVNQNQPSPICTEGVAALGLCGPTAKGETN
jgi:ribosomal protein L40E